MANSISIVSGWEEVQIVPLANVSSDDPVKYRHYELSVSHRATIQLEFFEFYQPSLALHFPDVFAWAGMRLYRLNLEEAPSSSLFELDDEIRAVYPMRVGWCVVCETGIEVRSRDFGEVQQKIDAREILMDSWWEGDRLNLVDLQNRRFAFDLSSSGGRLVQVSGDRLA